MVLRRSCVGSIRQHQDAAFDPQCFGHPPECIVALGALQRLAGCRKAIIKAIRFRQNLGEVAEEWGAKDFVTDFAQSAERGAEQPFGGGNIASVGGEPPFKTESACMIAAQGVIAR